MAVCVKKVLAAFAWIPSPSFQFMERLVCGADSLGFFFGKTGPDQGSVADINSY
jgi:hypothetical protein